MRGNYPITSRLSRQQRKEVILKVALKSDGTQVIPGIVISRNLSTIRLRQIKESDWTRVVIDPAKYVNDPLWKSISVGR